MNRLTLRRSIRTLPPAAWLLFAGTFINKFGSFVLVFLAIYLTRSGYSAAQAGMALAAYGVGVMGSAPVGGYLADRVGRRNTIALSMFSSAATLLGLSQVHSLAPIMTLSGLVGFTAELYRPASSALLADLTPAGERVAAFAMYRLAVNLGFAAGPAVGGLVAERSFFLIFLGDALTAAAFGALALWFLPTGERAMASAGGTAWIKTVLRDSHFVIFLLASIGGALVLTQGFSTFSLQVSLRASGAVYGMLISLNALLVVLLELPIASVTQRLRPRPVMAVGLVLLGLGFGFTGLAVTIPLLVLAVAIWTLGEIVYMPVAGAYVADVSPIDMRGRYQGAWGLSFGVALVVGPSLGTVVFSYRPELLWLGCLLVGALAATLVLAGPEAGRHSAPRISPVQLPPSALGGESARDLQEGESAGDPGTGS